MGQIYMRPSIRLLPNLTSFEKKLGSAPTKYQGFLVWDGVGNDVDSRNEAYGPIIKTFLMNI